MAPNDVKTVSVQLTEAQAQQVLRTVEKDPDAGNWGEGNKTRNEVVSAFRSALSSGVAESSEQTEAAQTAPSEPAEPAEEPAADDQVEGEPDTGDEAADGQVEEEAVPVEPTVADDSDDSDNR
jgi:hypothetical protein